MPAKFLPVGEWLTRRADLTPQKAAIIDGATGEVITYAEYNRRANAFAAALSSTYHALAGDRVAIIAQNSVEYLALFMACAKIGAILVPLNWRLTAPELAVILKDCEPKLVVFDAAFAEKTQSAAQLAYIPPERPARSIFSFGPAKQPLTVPSPILLETAEVVAAAAGNYPPAPVFSTADGEETALILYTSGTTGTPKGAMLSHRMITWNAVNTQISWGLRDDDVYPNFSPFFHAGGLNVLTTPMFHCGGTVVTLTNSAPADILSAVERFKCTIVFAVPTVFQLMAEHERFAAADFSSVRFCISGGSSCPLPVIQRYTARGVQFRQGYGLTEAGVNCFSLAPEDAARKVGSVGKPIFHSFARITDPNNTDVPEGAEGELVLAGPHICSGYWRREEATRAAYIDGWWHTGDIARKDDEGYYFIVGRIKDMYKSGGENVYPAEVEAVLGTCPGVREIAVIGVPDEKWGESGAAFIVAAGSASVTADDVRRFAESRLAKFKRPAHIFFVEELPRNAMSKVVKTALLQRYTEQRQ